MACPRPSDGEFVNKDVISQAQDIYPLALRCRDLFVEYLKASSVYAKHVSACQHRFLTWASFLGVFASKSASLDRRLEFKPETKELVMSMLRVLKRNLERGLVHHARGRPANADMGAVEGDGAMYGIIGAVDRLHRLAVTIRQSPRADEVERVRNFASKQNPDGFPDTLSAIMQFLFPDAETTLQAQLVESIVYRRHRMLWSRRHSKKLGQQRKPEEDSGPKEKKTAKPRAEKQSFRQTVSAYDAQRGEAETESVYSSTLASRRPGPVHDRLLRVQQESQHEDHRSARSSNPPPRAQYPELPAHEARISCPYCLSDIEFPPNAAPGKKKALWIEHLIADLRPYVCVSEECRSFPTSFRSTKEWRAHMNENHGSEWSQYIHRIKWSCPFCGDQAGPISSEDLLVRHLTHDQAEKHPPAMDAFERAKAKSRGRAANPRQANHCPLCGPPPWISPEKMSKEVDISSGQPDNLYVHFIAHLEHLALLSISWWNEDVGVTDDAPDSGDGSADAIGFNSDIDGNQSKMTGDLIRLEDDDLAKLETTRVELELKARVYPDELADQQKQLWQMLEPSLDHVSLMRCQELRSGLEWRNNVDQDDLLVQLDELHERLRLEAEAVMPQKERLELLIRCPVEPPYVPDKPEDDSEPEGVTTDGGQEEGSTKRRKAYMQSRKWSKFPEPDKDKLLLEWHARQIRSDEISRLDERTGSITLSSQLLDTPTTAAMATQHTAGMEPFNIEAEIASSFHDMSEDDLRSFANPHEDPENDDQIELHIYTCFLIFTRTRSTEHLKQAIRRTEGWIAVTATDHPDRTRRFHILDMLSTRMSQVATAPMEVTSQPGEAASGPEEVATRHFNKWAILIGIDKYTHDRSLKREKRESTSGMEMDDPKDLRGAINDVLAVKDYLETVMNMDAENIKLLLAPAEGPEDKFPLPDRSEYKEPTYVNIVNALAEVPSYAKRGDLVYIHYSGHGGQATTVIPDEWGIDYALLPTDVALGGRYLRDFELRALLEDIVAIGAVLTVVLDCCHSGGAPRGEGDDDGDDVSGVRGVEAVYRSVQEVDMYLAPASEASVRRWGWKPPLKRSGGAVVDEQLATTASSGASAARGATITHQAASRWIESPERFAMLTACLETQKATETMGFCGGGGRFFHGQLTYWLLDTLRRGNPGLSSADIHGRVSAKIQNAVVDQTPFLFDGSDRFFFSPQHRAKVYSVRVSSVDLRSGHLQLDGGHMHGVQKEAEYAILPLGFELDRRIEEADVLARARIDAVQSGTSTATIQGGGEQQARIQEGCPAVLQKPPNAAQAAVRFVEAAAGQRGQLELGWAEHERKTSHGILRLLNRGEQDFRNTLFTVTVKDGMFQIKDESGMLSSVAADPLPWGTADSIPRLVRRLEHVAIYYRLRQLKNVRRRTTAARDLAKAAKTAQAPTDETRGPVVDTMATSVHPDEVRDLVDEMRDLVDVEIAPTPESVAINDDELILPAEDMPQNGGVYEVAEYRLFRITVTNKCEEPVGCIMLNLNPGLGINFIYPLVSNYCVIPGSVQGEENKIFEDFYVYIPRGPEDERRTTKNAGAAEEEATAAIPDLFKVLVSKPPGLGSEPLRLAKLHQIEQAGRSQYSDQADESLKTLKALLDKLKPATRDAGVARKSPDEYEWHVNNIELRAMPQP
ncbi:hypothetical protein RB595_007010 [Gaeumannomyces hyphopodioides]